MSNNLSVKQANKKLDLLKKLPTKLTDITSSILPIFVEIFFTNFFFLITYQISFLIILLQDLYCLK